MQSNSTQGRKVSAEVVVEENKTAKKNILGKGWISNSEILSYCHQMLGKSYRSTKSLLLNKQYEEGGVSWDVAIVDLYLPANNLAVNNTLLNFFSKKSDGVSYPDWYADILRDIKILEAMENNNDRIDHIMENNSFFKNLDGDIGAIKRAAETVVGELVVLKFDPTSYTNSFQRLKPNTVFTELSATPDSEAAHLKILFPYHIYNGTHWATVEIQVKKELRNYTVDVFMYDPLVDYSQMSASDFEHLKTGINSHLAADGRTITLNNKKSPYKKRQQDPHSCGAIAAYEITLRARGQKLNDSDLSMYVNNGRGVREELCRILYPEPQQSQQTSPPIEEGDAQWQGLLASVNAGDLEATIAALKLQQLSNNHPMVEPLKAYALAYVDYRLKIKDPNTDNNVSEKISGLANTVIKQSLILLLAESVLIGKYSASTASFLSEAVKQDVNLKAKFAAQHKRILAGVNEQEISGAKAAIDAILSVRERYGKNDRYKDLMPEIDNFIKAGIGVFLENDQVKKSEYEQNIIKGLGDAAAKHFNHRHFGWRVLADVLLALSVVGVLVLLGRKCLGKSFFFSTAKTDRQIQYEQAVSSSLALTCKA